jgi:hypothetical protein
VQSATLFRCGRPVLLVPPHAPKLNETVAIACKASLEAARAIAAAQPFMARAREVHLFTIDDGGEAATSFREAEEYLSLHYDEVRREVLTGESHQIGKSAASTWIRPLYGAKRTSANAAPMSQKDPERTLGKGCRARPSVAPRVYPSTDKTCPVPTTKDRRFDRLP